MKKESLKSSLNDILGLLNCVSGFFEKSCGAKPLIKSPKFTVIGGAGSANCCCGCVACIGGGGGGGGGATGVSVICGVGKPGINPCDVACANVSTGVAVVVSRHNENLPGCALI